MTPEQTLYTLPPDRFIAARDEAVAQARSDGDREAAARLAKLRRPTVAAWLVNLLALRQPEQVGELLDLAGGLREAQRGLRGDEIRQLSIRRREAIAALVGQVRGLAVAAGRPARETLPLAEVEATLTAALADEQVAAALREGRLTRAAGYAGFGEAPEAAPPGRPDLKVIDGGKPSKAAQRREVEDRRAAERAEKAAAAARAAALRQAEAALRQAVADEQHATREVAELGEQLESLRERHAAAEVAVREAKLRRKSAQRAVDRLG